MGLISPPIGKARLWSSMYVQSPVDLEYVLAQIQTDRFLMFMVTLPSFSEVVAISQRHHDADSGRGASIPLINGPTGLYLAGVCFMLMF